MRHHEFRDPLATRPLGPFIRQQVSSKPMGVAKQLRSLSPESLSRSALVAIGLRLLRAASPHPRHETIDWRPYPRGHTRREVPPVSARYAEPVTSRPDGPRKVQKRQTCVRDGSCLVDAGPSHPKSCAMCVSDYRVRGARRSPDSFHRPGLGTSDVYAAVDPREIIMASARK